MANLEQNFLDTQEQKPLMWLRYIDDIWMVWQHSLKNLKLFLTKLNQFHDSIKFTWEISHSEATILDITLQKGPRFNQTGILDIKTHFKETNKFQYLHYSSNHTEHVKQAIVTGESYRFLRSNSSIKWYHQTIRKHIKNLQRRGYPRKKLLELTKKVPHLLRRKIIAEIKTNKNKTVKSPLVLLLPIHPGLKTSSPVSPNIGTSFKKTNY